MPRFHALLLCLATLAFAIGLLGRLSHPLLWQDEGETAMFASRVLDHGYPKVHGERNVVYEFGPNVALGVKESVDAYIGKTWGDFYFAAPAVAWARSSDDPYAQAFRLRLPFALAGAVGLAVLLWGIAPIVPPGRRIGFAAAFVALSALSVSLLLHLREARYYALLLLVLAWNLALHLRHEDREPGAGAIAQQALASFLLFHVFHVAWFATTALLAADRAVAAWRAGLAERAGRLLRALLPHAIAVALVLPWIVFLETFQVARGFATHVGLSFSGYLGNLADVALHLSRQELLVPAVAALFGVEALRARGADVDVASRHAAWKLALFAVGYAGAGCLNPLVYERYFFVLGPILTLVFLLAVHAVWAAERERRRMAMGLATAIVLLSLVPRLPALGGRIQELHTPVRGPVDFVVEHLRERYPDPSALTIATNYEAHPLMFHLGSRVIVGLAGNNLLAERELAPDVVVPRRRWPRMLPELGRFLRRDDYEEVVLPVADVHYNQIAALAPSAATPDPHRFATPYAEGPAALRVHHRRRD